MKLDIDAIVAAARAALRHSEGRLAAHLTTYDDPTFVVATYIQATGPEIALALVARLRAAETVIATAGLDPAGPRCISLAMNVAREQWLALRDEA